MIITRAKLIDLARREVESRATSGGILSGYLVGSVAYGEPLLGGTADVDLVLIHDGPPAVDREMIPLSADVHLDVVHHGRERYAQPRALRIDPWIGPSLTGPVFLYDPQHFFEWAQAGARGQFFRADHTVARARALLQSARSHLPHPLPPSFDAAEFMQAALEGANAGASLAGAPCAGRRLLLDLERRAQALGRPEVHSGLVRLLGIDRIDERQVPAWMAAWARAFDAASPLTADLHLAPCRRAYHLAGYQALAEAGRPDAIVLPLLRIWNRTMRVLEAHEQASAFRPAWEDALRALGLSAESLRSRALELESYLDAMETLIDAWAIRNGA